MNNEKKDLRFNKNSKEEMVNNSTKEEKSCCNSTENNGVSKKKSVRLAKDFWLSLLAFGGFAILVAFPALIWEYFIVADNYQTLIGSIARILLFLYIIVLLYLINYFKTNKDKLKKFTKSMLKGYYILLAIGIVGLMCFFKFDILALKSTDLIILISVNVSSINRTGKRLFAEEDKKSEEWKLIYYLRTGITICIPALTAYIIFSNISSKNPFIQYSNMTFISLIITILFFYDLFTTLLSQVGKE